MKPIKLSPDVKKKLQDLATKNPAFYNKIQKQLRLFLQNPKHRSLRLHKVTTAVGSVWSISIDKGARMLYVEEDLHYYFFRIGTHDQVYRK